MFLSRNCPRPIRTLSSTAKNEVVNTRPTITKTIVGTASAASSVGSNRKFTKCTCAFCSAATALTPIVQSATADVFSPKRSTINWRDARRIGWVVSVMHILRDRVNTLLVVEHEEQIIQAADKLIDIGPCRSERGSELVFNGALDQLLFRSKSLTAGYLSGRKKIPVPKTR